MRTCDGAGVEKLYLCGITPGPSHPKVKKTSLGADSFVNCIQGKDTLEVMSELRRQGWGIVAVEKTLDSDIYFGHNYSDKTALIFGHEITGVSKPVLDAVDAKVEIPMLGKKQSLNVATSVGILAYHMVSRGNGYF